MSKRSYAEIINDAKLMISGLKSNTDRVSKRGLDKDFISKLESIMVKSQTLDNEQEDLKAKLKTKTSELDNEMMELEKLMSESKKVVKLEMPQETWQAFGISDKK